MEAYFEKIENEAQILDFSNDFSQRSIPIEIRTDHFTGRVSRILRLRWKMPTPSHNLEFIESARESCPFCPERIENGTPKWPEELVPKGRIQVGRSTVLPNAFPYSPYCGVTVFSDTHYIAMGDLSPEILYDAVKASLKFFRLVSKRDREVRYFSINWNYMPTAGGSLFHPHFQVVATPQPTHFHSRLLEASTRYRREHNRNYWADLLNFEKKEGLRYLFNQGDVEFLSVFSPGGIFGEVLALFVKTHSITTITDNAWKNFLRGLCKILKCFSRLNMDNLNMTLLMGLESDHNFWVQARIIPRILLPPWGTSDVNYFEKGHDEIVCINSPEILAEEIREPGSSC